MIEIKPIVTYQLEYSTCKEDDIVIERVMTIGMHVLALCICPSTNKKFYHTLPTGHTTRYPVAFSEDGHQVFCSKEAESWLARPLLDSVLTLEKVRGEVHKEVYKTYRNIIILNCLDDCYGHMICKLFNAQRHLQHHSECGLVVLIHCSLRWLVPQGVAEVWYVNTPVSKLRRWLTSLDKFVTEEMARFDKVYLSSAVMYLDLFKIDITAFAKVIPFPLAKFSNTPPQITFICREDRFWLTSKTAFFLYLIASKYSRLRLIKPYLVRKQNLTIRRAVSLIRKRYPESQFSAIGIGKTGTLGEKIVDRRVAKNVSLDTEKQWATLFARSHIVIGVHGSGMLIPTALAASFINLIPPYKVRHLGEDIVPRHSPSNMPFLGRFLDTSSSPALVAHHAVEILSGFFNHCFKTNPLGASDEVTIDDR